MSDSESPPTIIKVPMFYGKEFFTQIFKAAAEAGVQVIVVKGNIHIYQCEGGGATLNTTVVDSLFRFRGK